MSRRKPERPWTDADHLAVGEGLAAAVARMLAGQRWQEPEPPKPRR